MLYRLIIENYTSFSEQVEFDMFPNPKRENFGHHVIRDVTSISVLKSCALYGANGSGKSNFIKVLKTIKSFATEFSFKEQSSRLNSFYKVNRYKLPVNDGVPMSFLIEFSGTKCAYIYFFSIDDSGIKEESLYQSGLGTSDNILLFSRDREKVTFGKDIAIEEMSKVMERQVKSNPAQSVMSIIGRLHLIDNEKINDAFDWLDNKLEIIEVTHQLPWLINQLSSQPEVMKFIKQIFSNVGLGISDLSIRNESFEEWVNHADIADRQTIIKILDSASQESGEKSFTKMDRQFPLLTITEEDGERRVKELLFHQLGKDGFVGTMECESQSSGTLRLLTLVPAIYYAIHERKTVVIDEIDNSIHPMLIKRLIKFYGNSDSNGQLIFTTHETALLNQQELLRPDEVWMIEKSDGASRMYSLNDFKIHKTLSLENGYLDGRFGAIPFLGSLELLSDEDR